MSISKKIKCLIIDDEPLAVEMLKQYIARVESLELAGTCSNAIAATGFLQDHPVDLLFLDIQMPQLLGTHFIRTLKTPPKVIFTTAYRKYAVEGFELDAVDYILKPISLERFLKAVNKILQTNFLSSQPANEIKENHTEPNRFLYFKVDRKMVKVLMNDILFIEGFKDYVKIFTCGKTIVTKHVLSTLEEMLPSEEFIRIHRSFIVAINKIDSYSSDAVEIAKHQLPIGRLFKHDVNRVLNASSAS